MSCYDPCIHEFILIEKFRGRIYYEESEFGLEFALLGEKLNDVLRMYVILLGDTNEFIYLILKDLLGLCI